MERRVHERENMLLELDTNTRHGFMSERLELRQEWRVQDADVHRLSALHVSEAGSYSALASAPQHSLCTCASPQLTLMSSWRAGILSFTFFSICPTYHSTVGS